MNSLSIPALWECCRCLCTRNPIQTGDEFILREGDDGQPKLACQGQACGEISEMGSVHSRCPKCRNLDGDGRVLTFCNGEQVKDERVEFWLDSGSEAEKRGRGKTNEGYRVAFDVRGKGRRMTWLATKSIFLSPKVSNFILLHTLSFKNVLSISN